jgi:GTPase Era involved in 16S rRNA processing
MSNESIKNNLQLPMQSVPITTEDVSSNLAHGEDASVIRKITQEAKQELLNAFRCEMRFKLQIKYGRQK